MRRRIAALGRGVLRIERAVEKSGMSKGDGRRLRGLGRLQMGKID